MAFSASRASDDVFLPRKRRSLLGAGLRTRRPEPRSALSPSREEEGEARSAQESQQKLIRVRVARQALQTVFQPIVDLRTGGTVGAEALSRFSTPPIRSPDVWFAEAAEVGMEVEMEVAALHSALQQLRRLPSGLYLSLNASPTTMVSPEFRSVIADVTAERVVLELTEHTGIDDYEVFREAISELRSRGLRLAIDDAGSGFSSFRHILNLRPDIIKLDIALTRGIDSDPARKALGSALLTFGLDAYNATVVAEGIETVGEMNTLRSLGCKYGQGFYLGKPGGLPLQQHHHATRVRSPVATTQPFITPNGNPNGDTRSVDAYAESLALIAEIEDSLGHRSKVPWTS